MEVGAQAVLLLHCVAHFMLCAAVPPFAFKAHKLALHWCSLCSL